MATSVVGPIRRFFLTPGTDRLRMARNSLWSVAGSGSSQGASLLAAVIVARLLGVTSFGQLALIQATVLMMGTLGEMGLGLTLTKYVSRWRVSDPVRTGSLIGWAIRLTALSSILMAVATAALAPQVGVSGLAGLANELRAACALLVFEMLNRVQLGAFAGLEAFDVSARVQLWKAALIVPGVWLGAWFGGLLGAVLALGLVSMLTFAAGHYLLRQECKALDIPLLLGGKREPEVLLTSMSLWISTLLMAGSSWIVTVYLSQQPGGISELAVYNASDRWKTALLFLPQMLFQVTLPMLSHRHATGDHRSCRRIFVAALASTTSVTAGGALVVLAMSSLLMSSYGAGFAAGSRVLSLAALTAIASGLYTVGSSALWAIGKPTQMLLIDICKTALLLGLCATNYANTAWGLTMVYGLTFAVGSIIVIVTVSRQLDTRSEEKIYAEAC